MKITYLELFQKRNALINVIGVTNKLAYAKAKNMEKLNREIKIINEAHPVLAEYGKYEAEQQELFTSYKENPNEFNLKSKEVSEKYKEVVAQVNELLKEELDIKFYEIKIDTIPDSAIPDGMKEYIISTLDGIIVD